jgi:hypothetical protein
MDPLRLLRRAYGKLYGPFDYSSHILALHDYRAIYIATPKVANSSIKNAVLSLMPEHLRSLLRQDDPPRKLLLRQRNRLFRDKHRLMKHEVSRYRSYLCFGFVRNPWDRLVSCYMDKIRSTAILEDGKIPPRGDRAMYQRGRFKPHMTFEEFVHEVVRTPDKRSNRHFRSQHTFLTDRKGQLLTDFIGRFEQLGEDFRALMQRIGAPECTLPHVRATLGRDYRDYYTPELREMVRARYERDIDLFGYDF